MKGNKGSQAEGKQVPRSDGHPRVVHFQRQSPGADRGDPDRDAQRRDPAAGVRGGGY